MLAIGKYLLNDEALVIQERLNQKVLSMEYEKVKTKNRIIPFVPCGLAVILALTFSGLTLRAQGVAGANSQQSRQLDLKWVEAELALTEANLKFVLERNEQSPGSSSDVFAEELRLRAKLFETWREQLKANQARFIPIDIRKAEGDLQLAQMRLAADEQVRARIPNGVTNAQIQKRQLAVEAAKLWLEKVRDPSFEQLTKDERNQWRLIVLGKDILELRIESER